MRKTNKKDNKKTNKFPITILLILFIGICVALVIDIKQSTDYAYNRAKDVLRDSAESQSMLLSNTIDGYRATLDSFATVLGTQRAIPKQNTVSRMHSIAKTSKMHHVCYANRNGLSYMDTGQTLNVSGRDYYKQALKGTAALEYIEKGKLEKEGFFILAVPVQKNNKVIGVVYGSFDENTMRNLLISTAYGHDAYSFVCNASGKIVIKSESSDSHNDTANIIALLKSPELKTATAAKVQTDLENGKGNLVVYAKNGHNRVAVYQPLDIPYIIDGEYFIFSVVPSQLLTKDAYDIAKSGIVLLLAVSLLFVLILIYIRKHERKNRMLIEKHRQQFLIAVKQSKKTLFRYEMSTKKYCKVRGLTNSSDELWPDRVENAPQSIIDLGFISEASVEEYRNFFKQIDAGVPEVSCTVNVVTRDKSHQRWFQNDSTTIFDNRGKPLEAIISSYDVTSQRQKEVAYNKWLQELEDMPKNKTYIIEWNLSRDVNESSASEFRNFLSDNSLLKFNEVSEYIANSFLCSENREEYIRYFKRENLLADYQKGITEHSMEFKKLNGKDEDNYIWVSMRAQLVSYPSSQDVKAYMIFKDINEEKRRELTLQKRSEEDNLTGVLNRISFESKLNDILQKSAENTRHAVLMLDIDDFKTINDVYGHRQGDRILIEATKHLRTVLRQDDLLARLGGDEFIILLNDFHQDSDIEKKAIQLIDAIQKLYVKTRRISMSMGIAVYPRDGRTFDELYQNSDAALYFAKESGKNRYAFFSQELQNDK